MSDISEKDVAHVAHLARLKLSDAEIHIYREQLARVLKHMEELETLDIANVAPTSHVLELCNVLRDDVPRPSGMEKDILAGAPEREGPYFKVPKVIE